MTSETTIEDKDFFIHHAALVWRAEGCTVEQARFKAWCEGPEGYAKRLKTELDMIKEGCYD